MFFMYPCEMEDTRVTCVHITWKLSLFCGEPKQSTESKGFWLLHLLIQPCWRFNHSNTSKIHGFCQVPEFFPRQTGEAAEKPRAGFFGRVAQVVLARPWGARQWCRKMWDFSNEHPRMHHFHGKLEVLRYVSGCWFGTWILFSYFIYGMSSQPHLTKRLHHFSRWLYIAPPSRLNYSYHHLTSFNYFSRTFFHGDVVAKWSARQPWEAKLQDGDVTILSVISGLSREKLPLGWHVQHVLWRILEWCTYH